MNIITRCRGIKGKIHIFNCWGFRGCVRGRGGWTGRNKPTPFCAKDEKVQINDSGRRRGVWSNRRASQMQLTQGIANARSTLPNIISPRLLPRHIWEPNKLVGKGRSRGGGEAKLLSPQPRRRLRDSAGAGGEMRPARVSGAGPPGSGSGSAAPGSESPARVLPARWRRRPPVLESPGCSRAATGTGSGAGWTPRGWRRGGGCESAEGWAWGSWKQLVYSVWSLCS